MYILYINTIPITERARMLKSRDRLAQMAEDSENVFYDNIFDHYMRRHVKY